MNLQSILLFLFLVALLLPACGEKQESIPSFLTIDTKIVNFKSEPSTREIVVKTSMEDWTTTVQSDAQSWLQAIRRGNVLSITVSKNSDFDTRTAELEVVAGSLSETISVQQLGTEPAILLSSDIFTVSADRTDITLEVTSNIEYEVVVPEEAAWIKEKPETRSAEMVTEVFRFEVAWNTEEAERRAVLIVRQTDGELEKEILVIQKGQSGYAGGSPDDIKDDIQVPISGGWASSFQTGGEIEKSFDGNYDTNYHSNWSNGGTNYFPITLDYHFEDQESIDYLIYHPRTSGSNGNFKEVELWAATESEPNLVKLLEHDFNGSGSAAKIVFDQPLINPKTIRFIVKSGAGDGQGFASCAEMEFYRTNPDNFDPLQLFTDLTCSELKPGIGLDDIENVSSSLYRNIALYLLNDQYPAEFRIQEYKAWPHPRDWASENKTSALSLLDNPTGIGVQRAGDELVVFVGDTYGQTISMKIQDLDTPGAAGYDNASFYPLSTGVNKIKARHKGLIYIFYHTPDYASVPPVKIHFASGEVNGYFDSQKHESSDWRRLLDAATNKYFDVLGEHAHLTFETSAFRQYARDNGPQLIAAYDNLVRQEKEFMGLMKYDRPTINRAYFKVIYTSYMYATSYRTSYNASTQQEILTLSNFKSEPWGPAHEMGHVFQTRPGFKWLGMTEVTNNVHSLYVQTEWGNDSRIESENMGRYNNRYEKAYHNSFVHDTPHPGEEDVFCKLVSLWQLQLYFSNVRGYTDVYKDLYERVRTSPDKPNAGEQQLDFVRMMCDITGTDLTGFFTRWGYLSPYNGSIDDYGQGQFLVTQNQIDRLIDEMKERNYAPMTEKIEYICDSNWEFFKNRSPIQPGTASKNGVNIVTNGWRNVVAYEAYDGEQLIFVTNKSSFALESDPQSLKIYAVAFDGNKTEVNW